MRQRIPPKTKPHTQHYHPQFTKKEREGAQALKPPNSKTERFLLSVDGDTALHHQMCWGLRRRNSCVLREQTQKSRQVSMRLCAVSPVFIISFDQKYVSLAVSVSFQLRTNI